MNSGSSIKKTSVHALAHATFIISSDDILPEVWTDYFGVSPSQTIMKGRPYLLPSGRLSERLGRFNLWGLKSKPAVHSDQLEPHLRYLVKCLALPRADLREMVERSNAQMRFFCYWDNENGDRVPNVPEDIKVMMESLGGTVEVDEYR
jgi:hypothetical protein